MPNDVPLEIQMLLEAEPSPDDLALYDRFIEEYIKDFNPFDAALRLGFQVGYAAEYAKIFLTKPYVLRKIIEYKTKPADEDDKNVVLSDKQLIMATLRECAANGTAQTRVAAAKTLAGIHGLDQAPDRSGEAIQELVNGFKEIAKAVPD